MARSGIIVAILYVTVAALYVASLPTAEACYASGRSVEISHRYCVGDDLAPVLMRTVGVQRALGAGALLVLLAMVGRPLVRTRQSRSRPAG
jgi:hypothetical protein